MPSKWVDPEKYNGVGYVEESTPLSFEPLGKIIQVSPGKFLRSNPRSGTPYTPIGNVFSPASIGRTSSPKSARSEGIRPNEISQRADQRLL